METKTQTPHQQQQTKINNMKRSSSSNSESQAHLESPLRFHSPLRSDQGDPPETPPYASPAGSPQKSQPLQQPDNNNNNSKAIVAVDEYTQYSPLQSPIPPPEKSQPQPPSVMVFNRAIMEEVGPGEGRSGSGSIAAIVRKSRREEMVKLAALGFRISEVVLCFDFFLCFSC